MRNPIGFMFLCLVATVNGSALAQEFSVGKIKISQAWTRVTPPASKVAGGFMTITNTGTEPDTLIGGTALISQRIEIHEMAIQDGIMKMRELKPGLIIKSGETIMLKPGSYHVMFMDLKEQLSAGNPFKGTLIFEKAGTVEIEYKVEPFGTRTLGDGGQTATDPSKAHGGQLK